MWCWRHRHPPPARRVLAPTVDKPLGPAREEVGWADGTLRRDHGSVVNSGVPADLRRQLEQRDEALGNLTLPFERERSSRNHAPIVS